MSESNYNWVCFECRFVKRQAKASQDIPKCNSCNRDCVSVGYKLEIPKKTDKSGWEQLKKLTREMELENLELQKKHRDVRIAQLTNQINILSSKEENKDRTKLINTLKEELDHLLQQKNHEMK